MAPIQPLGLLTVALIVSGTLLLLRIYAIYNRSVIVLGYLGALIASQVAVSIYLFTFPGSTVLPLPPINTPAFHGCLYIPSPRLGLWASSVLVLELVYDVSVFCLIAIKAWKAMSFNTLGLHGLMYLLIKDGAMYFLVIFSFILLWFMMDMLAPEGLKCINALYVSKPLLFHLILVRVSTVQHLRTHPCHILQEHWQRLTTQQHGGRYDQPAHHQPPP
ncbi:hypothetical protein K439DRAFT_1626340 [Ramaria rubella]|nr:hypothetical protein K439DRAFT_1626340 [Ramaria rubella]